MKTQTHTHTHTHTHFLSLTNAHTHILSHTPLFLPRRMDHDHVSNTAYDWDSCSTLSLTHTLILSHTSLLPCRMDHDHVSNTAYDWDNYSKPVIHPYWQPVDWREIYKGHVCYHPAKVCVCVCLCVCVCALPTLFGPCHSIS